MKINYQTYSLRDISLITSTYQENQKLQKHFKKKEGKSERDKKTLLAMILKINWKIRASKR